MEHSNETDAIQTFTAAFAESFAEALTGKQGRSWKMELAEPDTAEPLQQPLNVRLSATGGLQGVCLVTFERLLVKSIGTPALAEAEFDEKLSQPEGDALDEIFAVTIKALSIKLHTDFGEVRLQSERVDVVPVAEMVVSLIDALSDEGGPTTVELRFDQQMVASLSSPVDRVPAAEVAESSIKPMNLQLVMDVELNVSLRFGQCQLPLRDVLDLNSGSIIELDRDVDDPVELLLDGKVIARGEAVIVDGNYGLRITEIPQPIASHFASQSFRG